MAINAQRVNIFINGVLYRTTKKGLESQLRTVYCKKFCIHFSFVFPKDSKTYNF